MKTKKIYVREHSKKEAQIYAEGVLQHEGIPKTDPAYDKLKEAYVENFLYQGVTKSMLPGEVLGMNPSTPRVNEKLFKSLPLFQKNGVFDTMKDGQEKKLVFRSSIGGLTNIILEGVYNKNVKRDGNQPSSKEFLPDGKNRLETIKNQYLANAITTSLIAQVEPLLDNISIDIDQLLKAIFGDDIEQVNDDQLAKELHNEKARYIFVQELYRRLKDRKRIEVRQNPRRKKVRTRKKQQHRVPCIVGAKSQGKASIKLYSEDGTFVGRDYISSRQCPYKVGSELLAVYEGPLETAQFKKFEEIN